MQSWLLFLLVGLASAVAADDRQMQSWRSGHPAIPEKDGLRPEVTARLGDLEVWVPSEDKMQWVRSFLHIEVAVRNVSNAPITVPTMAFDGWINVTKWPGWGEGRWERITFTIMPPKFQGKITAYADSRFAPVTLAPGECALLLNHVDGTNDRKRVDMIEEAAISFGVSGQFKGRNNWWTGHLETYAPILRDWKKSKAPESKASEPAPAP
jgi:hypothetical protein